MTSFADLKTRMADDLDRPDMGIQIDRELRQAVKHYEKQRWWFNEQQATALTVASQPNYGLPADLLVLDSLELTFSSRRILLNEIQWERYLEDYRYSTTTPSVPSDWAYYSDQLWLGPMPNDVYTLDLGYVRTLYPASFTDGTENAWTNYAEDLITARALKTLGARPLQLANGTLATWQQLEHEAYTSLCGMHEERVMTGAVRPWSG